MLLAVFSIKSKVYCQIPFFKGRLSSRWPMAFPPISGDGCKKYQQTSEAAVSSTVESTLPKTQRLQTARNMKKGSFGGLNGIRNTRASPLNDLAGSQGSNFPDLRQGEASICSNNFSGTDNVLSENFNRQSIQFGNFSQKDSERILQSSACDKFEEPQDDSLTSTRRHGKEIFVQNKNSLRRSNGDVKLQNDGKEGSVSYQGQHGIKDAVNGRQDDRIYSLGRTLTSILRHRAVELKLDIRSDGYVAVEDLLKLEIKTRAGLPLRSHTVDDILKVVEKDNKQRFGTLTDEKTGQLLVRANQGHTLKVIKTEELLQSITSASEIPVCVHGTFLANIKSIMAKGLKRMQRNHVHFASGLPSEDGVISGMKSYCEVLIYLNVERAMADGMKFYISENGVILTEGFDGAVPSKYFAKILKWPEGRPFAYE